MYAPISAILLSVALFLGMLACAELGYRIGRRNLHAGEQAPSAIGVIDAAVFAMLGLLLAFAFAGGMSRLDARRQLIVREANAISTANLRLDTLPPDQQPAYDNCFEST